MQTAQTGGDHNIVVQLEGEGHQVQIGVERVRLELTRFSRRHSATRRTPSPLERLSPYSRSSTLRGRDEALHALGQFIQTTDRPVSVRVLTGAGGSGKTRLALELCERWAEQGWQAGFATSRELTRFFAQSALRTWGWSHPTLVVIDYASAHAHRLKNWLLELAERDTDRLPPHPLRILLLERQADMAQGWMHDLFNAGGWDDAPLQDLLDPPAPILLPAITAIEDRTELLNEMLAQFGRPDLRFDAEAVEQQLRARDWRGDPLFLMMAAAHAADTGSLQVLKLGRTDMATRIAQTERDRLTKLAHQHQPALSPELLRHLAACVTLAQGRNHADLLTLAKAERIALGRTGHGDDADYADLLCDALPDPQTQGAAPVLPDLIGEAFVLNHFGTERQRSLDTDLLRLIQALRAPMAHTLVRCAQDFLHGIPDPDKKPPLSWLHDLVKETAHNIQVLDFLADNIPPETVVLRTLRLHAEQARYIENLRNPSLSCTKKSEAAEKLGFAFAQSGLIFPATKSFELAIELITSAKNVSPNYLMENLTRCKYNLANTLLKLGDTNNALTHATDIFNIFINLAQENSEAHTANLALSANLLSLILNELGNHEQATAKAKLASGIYRLLSQKYPNRFKAPLAISLNTLAISIFETGEIKYAQQFIKEAIDIFHQLSLQWPDAFLPHLASSLNNFANIQKNQGIYNESLATLKIACGIFKKLTMQNSHAFQPDLVGTLHNLAIIHIKLNQYNDAYTAAQEALLIYRKNFQGEMASPINNLATHLTTLGQVLKILQRSNEAFDLYSEAIKYLTPLVERENSSFYPLMAESLKEYLNLSETTNKQINENILNSAMIFFQKLQASSPLPPQEPPHD